MIKSGMHLVIPASIAGTLTMRPALTGTAAPVTGLTGADLALWLVIMDMHGTYGPADTMKVEQFLITDRFGRITRQRMLDAMRRIAGSEIYLADNDRWVPAITSFEEHPMPRVDPRVPTAPEWSFSIDTDLLQVWRDGVEAAPIRIICDQLRQLTSRYAVAAWLRFLVWPKRLGIAPPDHWNLLMPTVGTGMKADVPIDELGDMFGYDGYLPLSKVKTLLSTEGGSYPVVRRELIRVGVDIEMVPVLTTWHKKPVAWRLHMGGRYLPLENMTDGRWTEKKPVSRPKQRKRKIAKTAIA